MRQHIESMEARGAFKDTQERRAFLDQSKQTRFNDLPQSEIQAVTQAFERFDQDEGWVLHRWRGR